MTTTPASHNLAAFGLTETLLTMPEVCTVLRISRTTCKELLRSGKLQRVDLGVRGVRIKLSSVRQLMEG